MDFQTRKRQIDNNENTSSISYTINLELRMAQTMRFLASIHAASAVVSNDDPADDDGDGRCGGDGDLHLKEAISDHDMAVSLLVGVFDEEEDDEGGEEEEGGCDDDVNNVNGNHTGDEFREEEEQRHYRAAGGESDVDIRSGEISSEPTSGSGGGSDDNIIGDDRAAAMLTISVPNDPNNRRIASQNCNNPNTKTMRTDSSTTTKASFLFPTEDQRVRAIAVSLNALAELHARSGDDWAAMDSYREALEILRAATEEDDEECEEEEEETVAMMGRNEDDDAGEGMQRTKRPDESSSQSPVAFAAAGRGPPPAEVSPIRSDLANTLMNVGNFHQRRDELDAALNAYSTAWALSTTYRRLDDVDIININIPLGAMRGDTIIISSSVWFH